MMAKGYRIKSHRINEATMKRQIDTPSMDIEILKTLHRLVEAANEIYMDAEVPGWRESETSPPLYVQSWEFKKFGNKWYAYNTDPGGLWVEFGTHPGGGDFQVLGYRPLGKAVAKMSGDFL